MKRKSIFCTVAIAAALAFGAMAGCASQPASSASASAESASAAPSASAAASETASEAASESASASEAAEKSQDEIIAELKESVSNVPAYKSVTVIEKSMTWPTYGAEAAEDNVSASAESGEAASSEDAEATDDDFIEAKTTYQFDESGDKPKTSAVFEMADIKLKYYTDGDDAVCVTDGPVYSGTVEQFGISHAAGADAYLKATVGDLDTLIDCITLVTQDEINGVMGYELTLDPQKLTESDESLKIAADAGDPVQEAYVTVGFDKDGRIVWMTRTYVFSALTSSVLLDLENFDSTVIEPMPEATNTYEEMEADMQMKFDELANELDTASEPEAEEDSADAEVK